MMELDVYLSRYGDEPWGFRLIGGVDYGMPLTVVKVSPESPAEKAGLQNGDTVLRINETLAEEMSHDDSRKAVAAATDYLPLGVIRGLYDPVLDDQEPIFEPIDQDDFDQPSRPTEVQFELKDFTDIPQLNELPDFLETRKLSESRSLTASPFVLPTKPYRPFSTEPLTEIPVLEDPIILNPEYNDVFSKLGIDEDFLPKTRFKLPVSEQYDPDGTRQRNKDSSTEVEKEAVTLQEVNTEVGIEDLGLCVNTEVNKEEIRLQQTETEIIEETMSKEEVKFMERIKHEIDLERIELTANSIVEESLIKAVTVAEEIKNEIDVELHDSLVTNQSGTIDSHLKQESVALISEVIDNNIQKEAKIKSKAVTREVNELVDIIDKTTEEIVKQKEVNVAKEIENFELINKKQQSSEEKRLSTKQEIEEIIETGSVKNKTKAFDKEAESRSTVEKTDIQRKHVEEYKTKEAKVNQRDVNEKVKKSQTADKSQEYVKSGETKTSSETKMSTSRLLAEQRAYTIGLQTIPHIKGSIHSSYHYNLLLKTFFIHLTDVMVALSRFILSEPVLSKAKTEEENDNLTTERTVTETVSMDKKRKEEKNNFRAEVVNIKSEQQNIEKNYISSRDEVEDANEDCSIKQKSARDLAKDEEEKFVLRGSKMAQLSEKKSIELTHRMDAVITEFQTKAGIEDVPETRDRRSRSRSKIEEEVMKESDPLVWLEKVDSKKKSEEITTLETSSEFLSKVSESLKMNKDESKQECIEVKSTSDNDKTTYIAIVESHVYTNKDAILDEKVAEISETKCVQSVDATNVGLKTAENVNSQEVALQSLQMKEEVKKVFVEESQESSTIKSVENATVQVVNTTAQESQNIVKEIKTFEEQKVAVQINPKNDIEKKEEIIVQQIIEPAIEVQKIQAEMSETAVLEQFISSEIKDKQQESVVQHEQTVTTVAKRPNTLELNVDEDPYIVKKKLEVQQARSSIVAKEEVIEVKKTSYHEDPHIVKKKLEVQESNAKATKVESIATIINEENTKSEKDEFTALKVREEVREELQAVKLAEETQVSLSKQRLVAESNSYQSFESKTQENIECQQVSQEATFVAKSFESTEKKSQELCLNTGLAQEKQLQSQTSVQSDENNNIDTPTPPKTPTPLTDEYVFKLQIELPKGITPVPPDPSPVPENADLLITTKNLIPHIDTTIEQVIKYDPPLPTPPGSKVTSPVYTKPGLRGGADRRENSKEEILEIERKSSLLTSAIDQTIRSIEEYKEEVGINKKHKTLTDENNGVVYNGYAKMAETKKINNTETPKDKISEEWSKVKPQVLNNNTDITELSRNGYNETNTTSEVDSNLIDMKSKNIAACGISESNTDVVTENRETIEGYRPVQFNVEEIQNVLQSLRSAYLSSNSQESTLKQVARQMYKTETGEMLGTIHGIVDGLEEAVVDDEIAKEMGKPGITEEKIAELMSGESEMLREAHVMGLSRVLSSHMHRSNDDSSVDFQKIKPIVESLKDSEVLKALNEELIRVQEERKKKEEKKWTKFLQKPARPVPRVKFGYHGYVDVQDEVKEPYKVKIVKQPKPKVAPDYKPEDFNTGLLPWEERALHEPTPPPVEAEDPILIPEEAPEILEAVDPLPESEVPDLEDSGIPLPSPKPEEEPLTEEVQEEDTKEEELDLEAIVEETEKIVEENLVEEMDQSRIAEQLMASVQNMVDPNASLEQQLAQMRAQLAALAQLPCVIQQSLELVTRQLCQLSQVDTQASSRAEVTEVNEETEAVTDKHCEAEEVTEEIQQTVEESATEEITEETMQEVKQTIETEVLERMRKEGAEMMDEQNKIEKQKKELMEQMKQEHESRQLKQRPTPRVGKPRPAFGPITPQERPMVLPGGRKWRKPQDAYNEQFIAETLAAQAELIQGKAKGLSYESARLPYDERINFMKYEKPPVSLDHLKDSDVYKMIHDMEQTPGKQIEMRTPAVAEVDYREKCRSVTPSVQRIAMEEQVQP